MSTDPGPFPATPANIGKAVARKMFERRGNHAEMHITENELAAILTEAIRFYQTLVAKGVR